MPEHNPASVNLESEVFCIVYPDSGALEQFIFDECRILGALLKAGVLVNNYFILGRRAKHLWGALRWASEGHGYLINSELLKQGRAILGIVHETIRRYAEQLPTELAIMNRPDPGIQAFLDEFVPDPQNPDAD